MNVKAGDTVAVKKVCMAYFFRQGHLPVCLTIKTRNFVIMEEIIELLHREQCSCVIANGTIRTFHQRGVADLYELLNREPEFLQGSSVADKVIGKAAAALMVLGGVKEIYAGVISEPALALLQEAGVEVRFGQAVDHIINRTRTGWCPLETICYEIKTAPEILPRIREFMERKTM